MDDSEREGTRESPKLTPLCTSYQAVSVQMFVDVLKGKTLRQVAEAHGIARTTAEKRLRGIERALRPVVRLNGYTNHTAVPLAVMRQHQSEYLSALQDFTKRRASTNDIRSARLLGDPEIGRVADAARRTKTCPCRDVALIYALFGTGGTPLEIARLEIRDYLEPDGDVRKISSIRPEVAFNGVARPLVWGEKVIESMEEYLQERATKRQGLCNASDYRGFDPNSALFLTEDGTAFRIKTTTRGNSEHHLCHAMLDLYRRIIAKRMPGTGNRHHPSCVSYEPEWGCSGLGELMGEAIIERSGTIEVRFDFPLAHLPGRAIPRSEPILPGEVAVARHGISLRALMHLLWERAGFNRWYPAMKDKRSWPVIRKYLLEAAAEIETKSIRLSERLYVPEP